MQERINIDLEYLIYISSMENISLESADRNVTFVTSKLLDIIKRFLNKFIRDLNGQLKELSRSHKKVLIFNNPAFSRPNISFKTYTIDETKTLEDLQKCLSYYIVLSELLKDREWIYNRIEFDTLDKRTVNTIKKEYEVIVMNTYDNNNISSLIEHISQLIENMEHICGVLESIRKEINGINIKEIVVSNRKDRTPIEILGLLNDMLLSIIKPIFMNIRNYNKALTYIKNK